MNGSCMSSMSMGMSLAALVNRLKAAKSAADWEKKVLLPPPLLPIPQTALLIWPGSRLLATVADASCNVVLQRDALQDVREWHLEQQSPSSDGELARLLDKLQPLIVEGMKDSHHQVHTASAN